VETVDNAGTLKLKMLVIGSIKEFPRGISDQAISGAEATAEVERSPWSGLQAASDKLQASSYKLQASSVR